MPVLSVFGRRGGRGGGGGGVEIWRSVGSECKHVMTLVQSYVFTNFTERGNSVLHQTVLTLSFLQVHFISYIVAS